MNTSPVYRLYGESSAPAEIIRAMALCAYERLPFYYSGRKRIIRVESRNRRKMQELEVEFRGIGLKTNIKHC